MTTTTTFTNEQAQTIIAHLAALFMEHKGFEILETLEEEKRYKIQDGEETAIVFVCAAADASEVSEQAQSEAQKIEERVDLLSIDLHDDGHTASVHYVLGFYNGRD